MTVVFSDMKGFTTLGQGMMPVTLVNVVNHYLATMSEPVRRNGGIIDKYIGDMIMAFWGPPFNAAHDQARLACEAALGQLEQLGNLRASLPEIVGLKRGLPHLDMRIGIATGDVVVGNIGSAMSMSYTVMGDSVNLGSRLESVNKVYGTHLLVSEATMEMAKDAFEYREVDAIVVVGRDEPERAFELLGRRGEVSPQLLELARRYADALALYRGRAWGEAEDAFRRCLELVPDDGPSRTLLGRIPALAAQALPEDWNGAWLLAEK
jgi:adenylate cyclase